MTQVQGLSGRHIAALAEAVRRLPAGEQARLRRMSPAATPPPVFYALLLRVIPDARNGPETERAWMAIVQGMAILALSGPVHDPKASLGLVLGNMLHDSGASRFWRLLDASGDMFFELLRHIFRMLAEQGRAVDWRGIVWLCLLSGEKPHEAVRRAERCRQLAREFCRAQHNKRIETQGDPS